MRILYATMQFGRGYGQGTERYLAMLASGMQARGHAVTVLGGDPERRGTARELGEVVQGNLRVLHYPTNGWMAIKGLSQAAIRPLLEQERPDIVHIANPAHIGLGLQDAAASMGIPVVITVMDFWWLCPKHTLLHYTGRICDAEVTWRECLRCIAASGARRWVRTVADLPGGAGVGLPLLNFGRCLLNGVHPAEIGRYVDRQRILQESLATADAILFPSSGTRRRLEAGLAPDRLHDIPYGIEPEWFEVAPHRRVQTGPIDPADLTVGFAGAWSEHKGAHLLLDALQQLGWTRTRVRLAGGGTDPQYLKRLQATAAGLNVDFVGHVASANMPALLAGLDLLVMPSIWPENLPIIVLEAQAVGVPVLASQIDGVRESVPDAMIFEIGSASSLASRLQAWACDPIHPSPVQPVSTASEMVTRTLAVYGTIFDRARPGKRPHAAPPA